MSREFIAFLLSVACGAAVLLLWDAFHGIRCVFVRGIAGNFILDTAWWFISVTVFLWCIWEYMSLELRFFELFAFAGGAGLYHCTLSEVFRKCFCRIFYIFYKIFKFILKILLTPAAFSYKILIAVFNSLRSKAMAAKANKRHK